MKKILSVIIVLILNVSAFPLSNSGAVYDNNDINALKNIYNHNMEALNNWDFSDPADIEELEWVSIDNIYHLKSLDFSNASISGKIDLSEFGYIETYNLSNTNINEIVFPNTVNEIPSGAFKDCSELEYVDVSSLISIIGNNAFKNCSGLKSVILNNNNTKIMSSAFSGCVSLECLINANSIKSIGRNAFSNCDKLIFYDSNTADIYIKNYTQNMNYSFSTDTVSNTTGYVSLITNGGNQSSSNHPYKTGDVYLYDENSTLLGHQKLDSEGKFSFNNLLIGHKYKIVIDGKFAIAKSHFFVVTKKEYVISSKDNAFPIIACDFNKDGIITNSDVQILYNKCAGSNADETDLYDLNGDNSISAGDAVIVYFLISHFNEYID